MCVREGIAAELARKRSSFLAVVSAIVRLNKLYYLAVRIHDIVS